MLGLLVSLVLLLAVGAVGVLMNRAALRTAETIHRSDSASLAINNATLVDQYLLVTAKELLDFSQRQQLRLGPGDAGDQRLLAELVAKSTFVRYGAALTDLTGTVLTVAAPSTVLPPSNHPALEPLRRGLLTGQPGVSGVMTVEGIPLVAVAVPVLVAGLPRAVLIGYNRAADSQLQAYVGKLAGRGSIIGVADAFGTVTAATDPAMLGTALPPALAGATRTARPGAPAFVEYETDGEPTVGLLATGITGGWAYFRIESVAAFYGPVRERSDRINLALLGLILVAAVALTVMNHRVATNRRRSEQRFRALVHNAPDAIVVLDATATVSYESPSVSRLLGQPPDATIGRAASDLVHPDDRELTMGLLVELTDHPGSDRSLQCRIARADGGHRWVDLTATNLLADPSLRGIVINARDITDSRELHEQLSHQADHDALTDLPNRRRFTDLLDRALRHGEAQRQVAVLFVDLDKFKPVNDRYGHDTGDEVLRQAAARLRRCVRPSDVVARIGGDEFVVLLDGVCGTDEAAGTAERVVTALSEPFTVGSTVVTIGASVGVSVAGPGAVAEQVLRTADASMYQAKQAGGLRYATARTEAPLAGATRQYPVFDHGR